MTTAIYSGRWPNRSVITTAYRQFPRSPTVQTIFSLYNLAMGDGVDIGETVCRYALFHAFLELDDYEVARRHLDAFRRGGATLAPGPPLAGTA